MNAFIQNINCVGQGTSTLANAVAPYGRTHAVLEQAEVVMELFHAALRPSSRRTYCISQRAYAKFLSSLHGRTFFPFQRRTLSKTELNLAFSSRS